MTLSDGEADQKTISIDVWEDGQKKGLAGAMGEATIEPDQETGRMMASFDFQGIWQAPVDEALPAFAPSTTLPLMLKNGVFTLDAVTQYISNFRLSLGCKVAPRRDVTPAAGILHYLITDFDGPMLDIDPEAALVATYDYNGIWLAGTEKAISLVLNDGTDKITFAIPKFQQREIPEAEREGLMIHQITGQCNHTTADTVDALTITAASVA
jgi:hypothetical protein